VLVVQHGGVQDDFLHLLLEYENAVVLARRLLSLWPACGHPHGVARLIGRIPGQRLGGFRLLAGTLRRRL
jgi:hypothetical protein